MRTRRFSELDPVRLAGLLEAVPQAAYGWYSAADTLAAAGASAHLAQRR